MCAMHFILMEHRITVEKWNLQTSWSVTPVEVWRKHISVCYMTWEDTNCLKYSPRLLSNSFL